MSEIAVFPHGGAPNQVLAVLQQRLAAGDIQDIVVLVRKPSGFILSAFSDQSPGDVAEMAVALRIEADAVFCDAQDQTDDPDNVEDEDDEDS